MPLPKAKVGWCSGFLLFGALSSFAFGEEDSSRLGEIRVRADDSVSVKKHEIIKTEVISAKSIQTRRAQTLAEAVANQSGVDPQNSCANCGAKRLMINGLRGEHTTVLIDGIPMHSAVSSFYGMDSIPVVGIEAIEVSRGAGASLIAPEAIGGVLNVITLRPTETALKVDSSVGTAGTVFTSLLGSVVGWEGKFRLVLAGQLSRQGNWDSDANGVSEAPDLANQAFFIKSQVDLSSGTRLDLRYAKQSVDILGGGTSGERPSSFTTTQAGDGSFIDNEVANRFLGTFPQITDLIGFSRQEASLRANQSIPGGSQLAVTGSVAEQFQKSFYMHGYDYNNRDLLAMFDARLRFSLGENHFLTVGGDLKNEEMVSTSEKLYPGIPKDDFFYQSRAAYLQHVWMVWEGIELSSALRADQMRVDFRARTAKEFDLDQVFLAPRFHLKVEHSPQWTSRFMYGRGYRPPLSFFESQHGLNEFGFLVEIDRIETSHGLGYSLAYSDSVFSFTGSSHYTWLSGMAFASADNDLSPAIFRNSGTEYRVWANDVVLGFQATPDLNLSLSFEKFTLQDEYKSRLPAAAVENRFRFVADWHFGDFEFINTFTLVGARDLREYRYDQHYKNIRLLPDPSFPMSDEIQVFENKALGSPAFVTWDLYLGWKWKSQITFFASVQNVFGFTQASAGDSPLNWSSHGSDPLHFHLDNNHTWGPNRGRVFAVGLKAEI
jgi:outer membrane receptor for ferrienterochelin and colicins